MRRMGRPKGQRGWLYKKGGIYMLRWREEKAQPNGSVKIVQPSKSLGYFRTKSEARRAQRIWRCEKSLRRFRTRKAACPWLISWSTITFRTLRRDSDHRQYTITSDYGKIIGTSGRNWNCESSGPWTGTGHSSVFTLRRTSQETHSKISNHFSVLSSEHARRTGVLDSPNPMIDVSLPSAREAEDTYAYTLEEVTAMLMRLPLRSAAVVCVAAFTGLRKGEISALMWEQYREGLLYVEKSKWRTHMSGPKTNKSKSPVPVIAPLAKILERWRGTTGNPDSGWMFGSGPLDSRELR
jgi:integrase